VTAILPPDKRANTSNQIVSEATGLL